MSKVTVNGDGPLDAPILWVGEAPGRVEVVEGKPFVGPSGQLVRRTLRCAGIDPQRDVRFTNAVRHNPGSFPDGEAGAKLLQQYAIALDSEILSMPNLKVIVACGGPACTRLTGMRSLAGQGWGISDWRGSVLRGSDLPDVMRWSVNVQHITVLPEGAVIIPTLHPAGILRSKGMDEMLLLRRDVQKVKLALDGMLNPCKYQLTMSPSPEGLLAEAENAARVYFDTEYNPDNHQVFWVGMTFDGYNIYGMPWNKDYAEVVTQILDMPYLAKGAHNIHADVKALLASGGKLPAEPWYDTMIGMHALHPALDVGLDDAARFYIDDVKQWKYMDHSDPAYNAMDVAYGWACWDGQLIEAGQRPGNLMDEITARMNLLPVTYEMEVQGMRVDPAIQRQLRKGVEKEIEDKHDKITRKVKPYWDMRVRRVESALLAADEASEALKQLHTSRCESHPKYNGIRVPPKCEQCKELYLKAKDDRTTYKFLMKGRTAHRTALKRWAAGFVPTNNEHLRWLLYDAEGLKLPVQRTPGTRRPTANRQAIDKLASLKTVQARKGAFQIVLDIKEVQHLAKALSTFIDVPVDGDFIAHPPYKIHGTKTGRLASGGDDDERSDNRLAFNALNIPREWRQMYIPARGCIFVAADWRNVEGRLTAHFSGDAGYNKVLAAELEGGPKVHSVNAGIIYGIDPGDAKQHLVQLSGQERTAYDGGKRLTHAWSYGMKPPKMSKTFNITLEEAVRIDEKLSKAYPQLVRWRSKLVVDVLGVWEQEPGSKDVRCTQEGTRLLVNPFGWQLYFLGRGYDQANEVIAFLPQSSGAGMWTRCARLLHDAGLRVVTGTYDSFVLEVPRDPVAVREAQDELIRVMEQPWPQLDDKTFPIELSTGMNMGPVAKDGSNPNGLQEVKSG